MLMFSDDGAMKFMKMLCILLDRDRAVEVGLLFIQILFLNPEKEAASPLCSDVMGAARRAG